MRRLLLAALVLAAGCARDESAPADAVVDAPVFDAPQSFALLERQVGFGPRVPGTPGHAAQLEWMSGYLGERADTVVVQRFTHRPLRGGEPVELANVFARFRPDAAERILLVAHWDTRPMADMEADSAVHARPIPGANDGGSGVAVLLQLADALAKRPAPVGVDLLLVDGEDFGPEEMFLGSSHFAENLPPGYRPMYGIVVDMVADQQPMYPVEQNSQYYAPEVVRRVWAVAEQMGYAGMFVPYVGPAITDDHIPLNQAGIPTIDIIDFDYGPGNRHWHTLQDDLENTSPRGLEAVGTVLTQIVYRGG